MNVISCMQVQVLLRPLLGHFLEFRIDILGARCKMKACPLSCIVKCGCGFMCVGIPQKCSRYCAYRVEYHKFVNEFWYIK